MAWTKGKPRPKKEDSGKTETVTVAPVTKTIVPEQVSQTIAPYDTCRYHRTEEPRIFKTGEVIPDGWVDTPDKFKE